MIGGGGERRTLRLVAQYADLCNVAGDLDTVRHKLEVLRRHCADVGRDPAEVTTTRLGSLFFAENDAQADETRSMMTGLAGAEFVESCTIGTEDQIVDQVAAILDVGVDEPIFNLPFADPEVVARVGKLLTSQFA
jgi:alkanesulfonate monooxygenase SsuD/methylene tetrahydromethanopterin reductase-like flavin-dependent oxidoreductase (luciferase family)